LWCELPAFTSPERYVGVIGNWERNESRSLHIRIELSFEGMEKELVRPRRFELLTYSFGGCRSIQLSYGRVLLA
jgi:hypothetical protein